MACDMARSGGVGPVPRGDFEPLAFMLAMRPAPSLPAHRATPRRAASAASCAPDRPCQLTTARRARQRLRSCASGRAPIAREVRNLGDGGGARPWALPAGRCDGTVRGARRRPWHRFATRARHARRDARLSDPARKRQLGPRLRPSTMRGSLERRMVTTSPMVTSCTRWSPSMKTRASRIRLLTTRVSASRTRPSVIFRGWP